MPFLLLLVGAPAQVIWDNGNGNYRWRTGSNWSPNTMPNSGSNVQFNATDDDVTVSNIELRGNQAANSLTFNAVDDSFSLVNGTGSRTLTLTSGDITRSGTGVQTLAFTTLALGGASVMDIGGVYTDAMGTNGLTISAAVTGAFSMTKTGVGELILAGANTFSGGTTISAGTLTVQSATALGSGSTVTLGGGRLRLNTATTTITNLNLTANSVIDFATAATLNVTTLNLNGFTLSIENWTAASDFFYATNWTGAAQDTTGAAPMNLITFNGYSASNTQWRSFDEQITPVPEPSTYGALLFGALTGLFAWRRLVRRPARCPRVAAGFECDGHG